MIVFRPGRLQHKSIPKFINPSETINLFFEFQNCKRKTKGTNEIFEDEESDEEEEEEKDFKLCQSEELEDVIHGSGQRPPVGVPAPSPAHIPTHSHTLRHRKSKNRIIYLLTGNAKLLVLMFFFFGETNIYTI